MGNADKNGSIFHFLKLKKCIGIIGSVLILAGCEAETSAMEPKGPAAGAIADIAWFMFIVAAIVFVVVMGLLAMALIRRRNATLALTDVDLSEVSWGDTFILIAGVALPLIILVILFVYTLDTMEALSPDNINDEDEEQPLTIEIIGHQFWWEIRYPQQGFVTANEIHIPVGEPVRLRLTSEDVIHSFWVPELNGKIDLIPERTTEMWLQADSPGEYRGQCAELCGIQHAKMIFLVIADTPEEFDAWLANEQEPAALPDNPAALEGMQVFLGSACVYCHQIRGTNASSDLGPDLTHLASRRTIGAGILPNTRGHLAGWIIDSQAIKPGNEMPPMPMTGEELGALLTYLETLE